MTRIVRLTGGRWSLQSLGWWLVVAYGGCLFVPWSPQFVTTYYEYAMHAAVAEGLQFGTDLLTTYGPLGFIGLPLYHSSTYLKMIAANLAIYVIAVAVLDQHWRDLVGGRAPALWIVAILVLPGLAANYWAASLAVPLMLVNILVANHFLSPSTGGRTSAAAVAALLAPFVFVKVVALPLIAIAIGSIVADDLLIRKRVSLVLPAAVVGAFGAWLVAGQPIGHLPAFFAGSIDVAVGHRDAMSLDGPRSGVVASGFAATALWLVAYLWRLSSVEQGRRSLWPVVVLGATLFVVFQHGFGRAGGEHMLGASLGLASVALLMTPVLWRLSPAPKRWLWPATTAVMATGVVMSCMAFAGWPLLRASYTGPRGLWTLITEGTAPLHAAERGRFEALRQHTALPRLKEPVDVSRVDFGIGSAYGLRTAMLPTITGYIANTPAMLRRNRDYLADPSGPSTVLFAPDAIDATYPTIADALFRLTLRSHFDLKQNTGAFLIMERRATPRSLRLVPLGVRHVTWAETVALPEHGDDAVWVRIEVAPSVMGWMVGAAYKPAAVFLTVNTPAASTFRMTAMAREGFILSPLLRDLTALEGFYGDAAGLPRETVASIQLHAAGGRWRHRARITVEFFRVVVDP